MPKNPEHPPESEIVKMPFLLSSRFDSRETSQAPYDAIQNIVRTQKIDFSVFRLIQNWYESLSKALPSHKRWYVVVLGETPPEPIVRQVTEAIHMGKQVDIPDEAIYQRLVAAVRAEGIEHSESLDTEGAQGYSAMGVIVVTPDQPTGNKASVTALSWAHEFLHNEESRQMR